MDQDEQYDVLVPNVMINHYTTLIHTLQCMCDDQPLHYINTHSAVYV